MSEVVTWIIGAVPIFAIFLFGAVGEIITEKSGHLNLGIPGIMCFGGMGGIFGIVIAILMFGKNNGPMIIIFSIVFTLIFGGIMGLLYSFLTVSLRANQNITGLSITTFGAAFATFMWYLMKKITYNENSIVDFLTSISKKFFTNMFNISTDSADIIRLLFGYGFLIYLAIILALVAAFILKKTKIGLGLRAVGESPATADAAGLSVPRYRYLATIIGAAIAGFGGLTYIMVCMHGGFEQSISIETFGWLAVALVIFSVWRPTICIAGSFIFALLYQLPYAGFITVSNEGAEIVKMLPYVVTILILIITSIVGKKQVQPPASLGSNYFREDR
jgi:simple sugar transport system permease protein